jgi:hypothetical protein
MDHEVVLCQRALVHGHTSWYYYHDPISKKWILKAFGPLTRCKLNVCHEKWPCTKKWMCWFFWYMIKMLDLRNFFMFDLLPFFSILLPFFPRNYENCLTKRKCLNKCKNGISLPWSLTFAKWEHVLLLSMQNMLAHDNNVGLKTCLMGTSRSMVTFTIFSWCKPKWSRDEFNGQS